MNAHRAADIIQDFTCGQQTVQNIHCSCTATESTTPQQLKGCFLRVMSHVTSTINRAQTLSIALISLESLTGQQTQR